MGEVLERGQKITLEELKKMGWKELELHEKKTHAGCIILKKGKERMLFDPKKEIVDLLYVV